MRIQQIPLHDHGSPQGGRLGNPIGGFFFEGGKAAGSERGESRQGSIEVTRLDPDEELAVRRNRRRERKSP
jgi:hypothetical protein